MSKQNIGGYSVDLLTPAELKGNLEWLVDREETLRYRSVSYLMFTENGDAASTALTFDGPASGYAWAVKMLGAKTSQAAEVSVYLGESTASPPVAAETSAPGADGNEVIFTWTGNVLVLADQRVITVACREGTLACARLHVKQVPAERAAQL